MTLAIRLIRQAGDEILRKKSREVDVVDEKIVEILNDMVETMHKYDGVGLAGPQIGILKRIIVIDLYNDKGPIKLINPKIIKKSGAVISHEGCLSFPEAFTDVRRYSDVMVKAMDRNGRSFVLEAKDGSLLARAIQHEFDHLDGILFIDHVINRFEAEEVLKKFNLPPIQIEKLLDEPELEAKIEELLKQKVKSEEKND